jgi:hypothetical protein
MAGSFIAPYTKHDNGTLVLELPNPARRGNIFVFG